MAGQLHPRRTGAPTTRAGEHRVERAGELRASIANQKAEPTHLLAEFH
jgi:hypothetical protein